MKDFYIVKKSVKRAGLFRPKDKISIEDYQNFIDIHAEFTWFEETDHGQKLDKVRPIKKRLRAYLNYNPKAEKSFVHLLHSVGGYVNVQFDYKVTYDNLMSLLCLVEYMDCNLWQTKPKKLIVDEEYAIKYKKRG